MTLDGEPGGSGTALTAGGEREQPRWEFVAALILSLATLVSAFCGYQASVWNGIFSTESRSATSNRLEAGRQLAIADRQRTSDLIVFLAWFDATVSHDDAVATKVVTRFPAHLNAAFTAWKAKPVPPGEILPDGTPFDEPEYVLSTQALADAAQARAARALAAADRAASHSEQYILTTVLFASVLFLAGIAAKVSSRRISHGVVALAGVTLIVGLGLLLRLPWH